MGQALLLLLHHYQSAGEMPYRCEICTAWTVTHYVECFATLYLVYLAFMYGGQEPSYSGWTIEGFDIRNLQGNIKYLFSGSLRRAVAEQFGKITT